MHKSRIRKARPLSEVLYIEYARVLSACKSPVAKEAGEAAAAGREESSPAVGLTTRRLHERPFLESSLQSQPSSDISPIQHEDEKEEEDEGVWRIRPLSELSVTFWKTGHLAAGSFGKVFLLRHKKAARVLVGKHQVAEDRHRLKNIRTEARLLASLDHKHIVRFVGYYEGVTNRCLVETVLVTERLQYGELFDMISRNSFGGLRESKTRVIFRQLASALDYIHGKGVVHLDVKPENVLLAASPGKVDASRR